MDSRRLTIFPRTAHASGNIRQFREEDSTPAIEAPKPKFYRGNKLLDINPLRLPAADQTVYKTFTPIDGDPRQHYWCIHMVDPDRERLYCLAQEIALDATEHAY
jgi:hypothetical protein